MNTFIFFHLNLFFSSLEEEDRKKVIQSCYEPIIELVEKTNIPIGLEVSAMTLIEIKKLKPNFIRKLKQKINNGSIEIIGSGYSQLIGPLVPFEINQINQSYGLEIYKKLLNTRPSISLINEMTYSMSMTDILKMHKYKGFIMDRNNILKFRKDLNFDKNFPSSSLSQSGNSLPILWSDTNVFQRFQQYIFGDIGEVEYIKYLKKILKNNLIPIYSNDAEIFNFRPGRFDEERNLEINEWEKISDLIKNLKDNENIEFLTPSQAFEKQVKNKPIKDRLVSEANPIPVKKQKKYNLSRWATTGRDDLWLNSLCFKIFNDARKLDIKTQEKYLKKLCYFWSSDFRTHLTEKRWLKLKKDILKFQKQVSENLIIDKTLIKSRNKLNSSKNSYIEANDNYLSFNLDTIKLTLNKKRGLAIDSLSFKSHKYKPCIGTIKQGTFVNIDYAADFYSGNFVAELPMNREKITDLVPTKYQIYENSNELILVSKVATKFGSIKKTYILGLKREYLSIGYDLSSLKKFQGSVNVGIQTFDLNFRERIRGFSCKNGGKDFEDFQLTSNFNHSDPATFLVSSNSGLGATSGELIFKNNDKKLLNFSWDQGSCAVFPKLQNYIEGEKKLTRVFFSLQEMDDTNKIPKKISNFSLKINP